MKSEWQARVRRFCVLFAAWTAFAGAAHAQSVSPLAEAAEAYAVFQDDVSWMRANELDSAARLDEALDRAARRSPEALVRGWIAYGALSATQSPAFVRGVQSRVRAASRAAVLRRLNADLSYARNRPPGSSEAVQLVLASAVGDGARLAQAAGLMRARGDALRSVAWAQATQASGDERVAHLRNAALSPPPASADLALRLQLAPLAATPLRDVNAFGGSNYWNALAEGDPAVVFTSAPDLRVRGERMSVIDRMLTLAALRILSAEQSERPRVDALLGDEMVQRCLTLAQLQFRQCVSVTQYPYENTYCLARHGLREPGACFASLAQ